MRGREEISTLSEEDVTDGSIHIVLDGLTSLDHVTITELHALGTLSTQLTRDDDLATSGSSLHDETEDTIACTSGNINKESRWTKKMRCIASYVRDNKRCMKEGKKCKKKERIEECGHTDAQPIQQSICI